MPGDWNAGPRCPHEKEIASGRQDSCQTERHAMVRHVRNVVGVGEHEMEHTLKDEASETSAEEEQRPASAMTGHNQSSPNTGSKYSTTTATIAFQSSGYTGTAA